MSASNWIGILGAVGALITAAFAAIHGQRVDNRSAGKDQQQLEAYIMEQVKQDNQRLRNEQTAERHKFDDDLTTLRVKKDAMEQELKQRNAALESENRIYRSRYGKLKGRN